jgi:hypothetical protein
LPAVGRAADPMGQEVLTGERAQHRYQACQDEGCERFACRVYREGLQEGYERGAAAGFAQGEAVGYGRGHAGGFAEGAASCGDG